MSKNKDLFKGKHVLVGDYVEISAYNTTNVLEELGIVVDVVQRGVDIVKIIQNGNKKYDAIFTNNLYREGYDGETTLYELKKIDDFNTPVIIHTVSEDARDEFVNKIGFDEYIQKPLTIENTVPVLHNIWDKK